jgi:hypothetical protein
VTSSWSFGGTKGHVVGPFGNAVRRHTLGDDVDVVFVRKGARQTVTASLAERPTS